MKHPAIEQVKQAIRQPYAWPGGYPIYVVMSDGEWLCRECARANFRQIVRCTKGRLRDGWSAAGADIHWEGEASCAHCERPLDSAYGGH